LGKVRYAGTALNPPFIGKIASGQLSLMKPELETPIKCSRPAQDAGVATTRDTLKLRFPNLDWVHSGCANGTLNFDESDGTLVDRKLN